MGTASAAFFLFVILSGGSISFSQIGGPFTHRAECVEARDVVRKAASPKTGVMFACISSTSLDDLEKANP